MRKLILTTAGILGLAALIAVAAPPGPQKTPKISGKTAEITPQKLARRAAASAGSLPFLFEPTQQQFDNAILLNANDDNRTWRYSNGSINYGYSSTLAADDWLFVPVTMPGPGTFVEVSVEAKTQYNNYPECFEIGFGSEATPDAMTIALDADNIAHTQYESYSARASIAGEGTVYMGIHANSAKDMGGLYLRNISITELKTSIPLAPVVESSTTEGLSYNATVRIPSSTLQGKDIEGTVGLIVAVDGTMTEERADCEAGSLQNVSIALTKGLHTITYTSYIMSDGERSLSEPTAETVRAISTEAMTLPFFMGPTADEFASDCIVFDANTDNNTWAFDSGENAMRYSYNSNQADDWVFLPMIDFGAKGGAFDLSVGAKVSSEYSPESFELCVGRTADPADMTPMLSCKDIKNKYFESYTGKITIAEGGKWIVGIHCVSAPDQWNLYVANISITAAADMTPGLPVVKGIDFNGLSGSITYTLPTVTADNAPLTSEVGLIVIADGTEIARTTPAAAGSDVNVPMTLTLGRHTITASAFTGEGETALTGSPVVTELTVTNPAGYAYPLPFYMRPSLGEFETLTFANANGSENPWSYNSGADNGKGAVTCRTQGTAASDTWLFFPTVEVSDIHRIYTVSADIRAYLERYPEDFDICIGTEATPEAMTTVLVSERGMNKYLYTTFSAEFAAPAAGNYVIGIHRLSSGEAHTLSLCNVRMEDSGKSAGAPAAVSSLTAESDLSGALRATISFTMPTGSIAGEELDTSAEITATVTSPTGATAAVSGLPGTAQSVSIDAREGINTFEVTTSSVAEGTGEKATVSTYCGIDMPQTPEVSFTGSEDNMSLTLTWTDPARGQNGGAVPASGLSHRIYVPTDASGEYWNLVDEVPAGTSSYTYTLPASSLQDVAFVGVTAVNSKGSSQLGLAYDVLGTPYPLPVSDNFASGRYLYTPITTPTPTEEYSTNWYFDNPAQLFPAISGVESAMFCINSDTEGARFARLALPKFTTEGSPAARVEMTVYGSAATARAAIFADTYAVRDIHVGDIEARGAEGWKTVAFDLPSDVLGEKWVNLYVEVTFCSGSEAFIIRDYSIRCVYDKQLETAIIAPEKMEVGESYTITAGIANHSETAQTLPAVKCILTSANGGSTELSPATAPEKDQIAKDEILRYTYPIEPNADMIGNYTVSFELCDYTDQVAADNRAEAEFAVEAGTHPLVLDLAGSEHPDGGVLLNWSAPGLKHIGDDDIESYEAFEYGSNIGPWLNIDRDGQPVYGIGSGVNLPGQFEPKAFQVVDAAALPAGVVPEAASGTQYLMVITPEDGAAEAWLISPEIVGGSKVSFRLNILSAEYGMEQIDVLYSTTGRSPEDFTLFQTFSQTLAGWNPLEVTLPAEAKYFAFHYRCNDIFGICLDDIFYSPVADSEIAGYNIYCNGARIAEKHPDTSFLHAAASNGDKLNVAVVTEINGEYTEHPLSNTYTATGLSGIVSAKAAGRIYAGEGCIVIAGFEGVSATVVTPDGKTVAIRESLGSSESISLPDGVYIVSAGTSTAKVAVR